MFKEGKNIKLSKICAKAWVEQFLDCYAEENVLVFKFSLYGVDIFRDDTDHVRSKTHSAKGLTKSHLNWNKTNTSLYFNIVVLIFSFKIYEMILAF